MARGHSCGTRPPSTLFHAWNLGHNCAPNFEVEGVNGPPHPLLNHPPNGYKALALTLGGQARRLDLRDQMGTKQRLMRVEMTPIACLAADLSMTGVGWGASILEVYQQHLGGPMRGLMDAGE